MAPDERQALIERNRELQERLDEAEETLRALRSGEVDGLVVSGPDGDQVYTLVGADESYRVMVQGMAEGALALAPDGLILFSNEQFATLVGSRLERVMGSHIQDFVAAEDTAVVSTLLSGIKGRKAEVRLRTDGAAPLPVYLSVENLTWDGIRCLCLIVTDLSEQKRNQEIVAAEKLARSILEQAAEAILVVEPDGRISRASRSAERLAGVPVLQRGFDEVFRTSLGSGMDFPFREILSAARQGQTIKDLEATALTADGRKIELLVSAAILSGPDSELLGCVLNLTDITERKRRERQLKFQADIIETTAEAVIAIDPNRRVVLWNSGAEQLYGVAKKEVLGKRLAELYRYGWWDSENGQRPLGGSENQGIQSGESIHFRGDGTQVAVSSTVNVIGQEHGGGMFAVIRDISENKRAESVLRESEARERNRAAELQAIMEAVPAAVFIARDPQGREIVGNRTSYNHLRMPPGANLSTSASAGDSPRRYRLMKNGEEISPENLPLQRAARTGHAQDGYEYDVVFDDGASRCWFGNAVPLFDDAGNSRGAVGAFTDITEWKRAQERLQQTQKLESIGLLAGGIAHDFNNLLIGVIGTASLAEDMLPAGDPAVELLQKVIKTGEQLATLTRQMLAYAGKGQFLVERLNLSDLVPKMSGLVQPSIPKKIALHFKLEADLPPIEADRGQMQQVFMNLVLNAAEAIGNNAGLISVQTGARSVDREYIQRNPEAAELIPGKYIYLEVRDTGAGMDQATRAKIFDPFFTTKFTGRGLGLAAVSGIVRGHKGAIQVTSAPGQGSCFTVLLPAVPGSIAPQRDGDSQLTLDGSGTVLVVDDEQVVRETARRALARHGFEVLVATSGPEAIDVLKRHPGDISLVLLDLSMPGMSGQEALPELRKIRPGIKVVVSSGYNEAETMTLFKGHPVSGFIQKPYTSTKLAKKVKSTLSAD